MEDAVKALTFVPPALADHTKPSLAWSRSLDGIKNVGVVILAAGRGKRMHATVDNPKVLMPVLGAPLIMHLLSSIKASRVRTRPVIVIAPDLYVIRDRVGSACEYAIQESQLGTGHAVLAAKEKLARYDHILVLCGDHPLVSFRTIDMLVGAHLQSGAEVTLATVTVPHFEGWYSIFAHYGRVLRNAQGNIMGIIEQKDASPGEAEILEVNPSYFIFKAPWLWAVLPKLKRENAQGEYYLTDVVGRAIQDGRTVNALALASPDEALGINTAEQLEMVEKIMRCRLDESARAHTIPLPL